ncbi:hypothetical protein FACS1894166_13330 [Bacilli bacterium]|nr:hypothetical protein FACS1894166_13330 [Bacilli bacterium]
MKCKVIYIRGNHDTNGKYDFVEEYHLGERMSDTSITFKHHFNTDKLEPTPIGLKIQGHLHPNPLPAYSAYFNVFICAPGDLYSLDEIKIMIRKCMYQSIYLSNKA